MRVPLNLVFELLRQEVIIDCVQRPDLLYIVALINGTLKRVPTQSPACEVQVMHFVSEIPSKKVKIVQFSTENEPLETLKVLLLRFSDIIQAVSTLRSIKKSLALSQSEHERPQYVILFVSIMNYKLFSLSCDVLNTSQGFIHYSRIENALRDRLSKNSESESAFSSNKLIHDLYEQVTRLLQVEETLEYVMGIARSSNDDYITIEQYLAELYDILSKVGEQKSSCIKHVVQIVTALQYSLNDGNNRSRPSVCKYVDDLITDLSRIIDPHGCTIKQMSQSEANQCCSSTLGNLIRERIVFKIRNESIYLLVIEQEYNEFWRDALARDMHGLKYATVTVNVAQLYDRYVGEAEKNIASLFDFLRSSESRSDGVEGTLLILEGVELIGRRNVENQLQRSMLTTLLTALDGIQSNTGGSKSTLIVVGCTNCNSLELDPSLTRPGRFDYWIEADCL